MEINHSNYGFCILDFAKIIVSSSYSPQDPLSNSRTVTTGKNTAAGKDVAQQELVAIMGKHSLMGPARVVDHDVFLKKELYMLLIRCFSQS